MAAYDQEGTLAIKRDQRDVYEIDRFYRYEITANNSGVVLGAVFLRRAEVDAADDPPNKIAITRV